MNVNHPLIRAALVNVAIAGALALAACGVAALAFEFENEWTLSGSLIVAAVCSVLAVRNVYTHRRSLKGIR
jgi:hypothetical protein